MDFYGFCMYILVVMINETSMLKIVFSAKGHLILDKAWTGRVYNEEYARLYYIIDGEAEIWHHGEKFSLSPGNLYLVPPQSNMRYHCRDSFEIVWVHFNIAIYGHLDIFELQSPFYMHIPQDPDAKRNEMLKLISLLDFDDIGSQLQAKSLLLDIISSFFYLKRTKINNLDHYKINRLYPVLDYIDENLDKPIKLAELAKLAHYEQTYFSALFKRFVGISPIKYIINKRVDKAKIQLRNTNQKLSAIADDLGFIDAFHFSKTFKKITGESPSEFRQNMPQLIP